MPDELSAEEKAEIDAMSIKAMLSRWRFAPIGTFQTGAPYTEYFKQSMSAKREADPAAWTRASKELSS